MEKWNRSLGAEGAALAAQIYAASEAWDRGLLTAEFWRVFRETKDLKAISAISYLFYKRGESKDKMHVRILPEGFSLIGPWGKIP